MFAIAVTLLVLEISIPTGSEDHLLPAIRGQWPSYLAYVVSFSTIGAIWLGHNAVTGYLERADFAFLRLNLVLLLVVAFIPFPTQLLAQYIGEDGPERIAVTFYGITLFTASVLQSVLWRYALRERLIRPDAADEEVQVLTKRLTPGLIAYSAMIVLGLFLPVVAVVGYLAIALWSIVPLGSFRRGRSTQP